MSSWSATRRAPPAGRHRQGATRRAPAVALPDQRFEDVPHDPDEVGGMNHVQSLQILLVPRSQRDERRSFLEHSAYRLIIKGAKILLKGVAAGRRLERCSSDRRRSRNIIQR